MQESAGYCRFCFDVKELKLSQLWRLTLRSSEGPLFFQYTVLDSLWREMHIWNQIFTTTREYKSKHHISDKYNLINIKNIINNKRSPSIESNDVSCLYQAAHLVPHWYCNTSGLVSYFTWTHFMSILCLRHSTWNIMLKKQK